MKVLGDNVNVIADRSSWSELVGVSPWTSEIPPRRDRLRLGLQVSLIALDMAGLAAGDLLAHFIWLGSVGWQHAIDSIIAFLPLYLLAGIYSGAFASSVLSNPRHSMVRGFRAVVLTCLGVVLVGFFLKSGDQISRVALLMSGVIGATLVVTMRPIFYHWAKRLYGTLLYSEVLLLDGCHCEVPRGVFALDAAKVGLRCDLRDPHMLDRIGRLLAPADRVIVACPLERRRDWAMMLKGANVRAEIMSSELTPLGPLGTARFGGGSTVIVAAGSLDIRQRMMKRLLDIGLASAALIMLSPLLAAVAIAVRVDSQGAVFFRQRRVGRGNRQFGMFKFRSMRSENSDHAGERSTKRGDDRITRVGRIIRSTSIDELPQLINILKGDMSFVGPRPHALGSLAGDLLFWEVDERYWHRHACKPGLTGLAQVRGFRGATHSQSDLINRLQADLEYLAGWTIWRDISILLATVRVVIHRNAY